MIRRTLLVGAAVLLVAAGCQHATGHARHPAGHRPSASAPAGGPSPSGPASAGPSPSAPPSSAPTNVGPVLDRCHTAQLVGRFAPSADGGTAGVFYGALELANRGATCQLYGYPGMQLYDAAGHPVPTDVVRSTERAPTLITLRSGGTAWAELRWSPVNGTGDHQNGQCQPTSASARVTPPDETTQLTVAISIVACERGRIDTWPMAASAPFPLRKV
jgi:hypothetical protein